MADKKGSGSGAVSVYLHLQQGFREIDEFWATSAFKLNITESEGEREEVKKIQSTFDGT